MELSSFSENIVTETFERNGEKVELKINIDAIVPDYYDQLEERLKPLNVRLEALQSRYAELQSEINRRKAEEEAREERIKKTKKQEKPLKFPALPSILPLQKQLDELQREAHVEKLTCPVRLPDGSYTQLLKDWSIVENGIAILPSKENLMRLPPKAVQELWERSIKRATSMVKKRVDEETEETLENSPSGTRALHAVGQAG